MQRLSALGLLIGFTTLLLLDETSGQNPTKRTIEELTHQGYRQAIKGAESGEAKGFEASFEMVPIPGGTFVMGSPETEPGRNADEGPQHWVTIPPFWMGKTEVTWDEYEIYQKEMGVNAPELNDKRLQKDADAITGPTPPYVDQYYNHGAGKNPALCMTQHAACEYCRWLSRRTGKHYRLPTEAEWEYAARAGTTTAYFFGDDPKDLGEYAWYSKNAAPKPDEEPTTHEVGKRKPNPWGLYDMYGNVMEWCLDHYAKDFYRMLPADRPALAPILLPSKNRFSHVARGGSWTDEAPKLRSAARIGSTPEWIKFDPQRPQSIWWLTNWDYVGFRVVRPVQEQENLKNFRSRVTRQSPDS
jgi:formylglycine-generating enzyme required for sulfatase activity